MKVLRKMKKGFTIVELVIVIAVIAVLTAILVPTFVSISNKADKASDTSLVTNLNTALKMAEGDNEIYEDHKLSDANECMHDAVLDLKAYGFNIDQLVTKSDQKLLYSLRENRFYLSDNEEIATKYPTAAEKVQYLWAVQNSLTGNEIYSVYAGPRWTETSVTGLKVGFDVGSRTNIESISYQNSTTQKVVIRTNSASTTLTIDDESTGSIYHYGVAGALNIIQCHTASYHENGKAAYAEIAKGRIVLEKGADVEEIHVNKKTNSSFDTVIIANNGGEEELPQRITRDAVTVSEETLVVKVESNGASENVYVYADGVTGTKGSTQKVVDEDNPENNQNASVNSALGQLVLDNGATADKAQDAEEKAEAKDEVASEAVSADFEKDPANANYVARIGQTGYLTLQSAVDAAVDGNRITLLKNIDFASNDSLLVNKDITLNLGGKSITGSSDPMIVIGASKATYQPSESQLTHAGHLTIKGEGSINHSNWDMICVFDDAVLDIYGGNYVGYKASFYISGGTLNTYGGYFTSTALYNPATTNQANYIIQVKNAGSANIIAGEFYTPEYGCYGVYLDYASVSNFGSETGDGPVFNTWRPCIATNGSKSHSVTANIYSGTYHAYRSDSKTGENSVIQFANDKTTETQTLNIFGGIFEQTGSNTDRCIFNVRYRGNIVINFSGGTFIATSTSRLFNGVGSDGSGWPSSENVHITVNNNAISVPQNVKVYNTSDVHQSAKDFELTIE